MSWSPVTGLPIQYSEDASGTSASGTYLKFYASGTTTPISMATDSTGATTLDKCVLNSLGQAVNGSSAVFIPHVNQKYKAVLYPDDLTADEDTFASAIWVVDGITPSGVDALVSVRASGEFVKEFDTMAAAIAATTLVVGDVLLIKDRANSHWDVVLSSGVTENTYNIVQCTGVGTLSFVVRSGQLIYPETLGVDVTGATDASADMQAYIDYCVTNGRPILGKASDVIDIGTNLFIYGDVSIEVEKGHTWQISTEVGAGADGNKYIIVFGVPSFGGAINTWNGTCRGLKVTTTATTDFERALFILSGDECLFDDVEWDFTATDFTGTAKGGPIESGTNGTWATGTATRNSCIIKNSVARLNHGRLASEGIALAGWDNAELINCHCYGSGDDVFAIHTSERGRIYNCVGATITGRVLCDNVKDFHADNNTVTKIEDPHTLTWYESNFLEALMSSSVTTGWANETCKFTNNKMIAPDGSIIAYWMRMQGTQYDLELSGNKFDNYSATANTIAMSIEATISSSGAGASWVGPTGNPDSGTSGIVRVRKALIHNNSDVGQVSAGTVQQVGTDANLIGPFIWDANYFNDYEIFSTGKNAFLKSNSAKATTGLTNVIHGACIDADRYTFTFTGLVAPTYVAASKLTATPVLTVCRVPAAGRIVGAYTSWDQNGTGGQSVNVDVLKNGSSTGSYSFGVGSATYNERSYRTQAGTPATLEVVEGDIITVEMWNSAGQLVALKGNVTVLIQPIN